MTIPYPPAKVREAARRVAEFRGLNQHYSKSEAFTLTWEPGCQRWVLFSLEAGCHVWFASLTCREAGHAR